MLSSLLSKINSSQELTEEDRSTYASKLEYISTRTTEIYDCKEKVSETQQKMEYIDKQFHQIEDTLNERSRNYNKLLNSLQRLTDTIKGFKYVSEATKGTWDKFDQIEEMIVAEEKIKEEQVISVEKNKSYEEILSTIDPPALKENDK